MAKISLAAALTGLFDRNRLGGTAEVVKPRGEEPPELRVVNTSRGGPNMPKYQPCSIAGCGLSSKRAQKTRGGANYTCRRHGKFFVRAM